MVHELFKQALLRRYEAIKAQNPEEGRRKWRLRVLYESWPDIVSDSNTNNTTDLDIDSFDLDPDPIDQLLQDEELGLIIRTDFTNDGAWNTFSERVLASQKEFISELMGNGEPGDTGDSATPVDEADEESDSSTEAPDIVKIIDPSDQADRARLNNISNLAALRLFNDVDIRPAPSPPSGTKRISPPNPLIDQGGWQEIYAGKNIWIYDSKSNSDECVRVVSQVGDFYGTATADSWRARALHICELQFNISNQGMKIDFNGLDRWDWDERARNLSEATSL